MMVWYVAVNKQCSEKRALFGGDHNGWSFGAEGLEGAFRKDLQWGFGCAWGQPALLNTARNWAGEKVVPWRNASLFLGTGIMG